MKKEVENRSINPMQIPTAVGIIVIAVCLITESDAVAEGIRAGLSSSANILIPALFPFMALAGFLSLSDYGRVLALPLGPIFKRLFKIPGELGPIVLLSWIGGYPVGARSISTLLERGRIERDLAGRMLCFCVNCGPSFLITAVGSRMLADRKAGIILFATQTAATLLVGVLVSLRSRSGAPSGRLAAGESGAGVFVLAVSGACSALITMCGFAVLFSGIFPLIEQSGICFWLAAKTGWEPAVIRAAISGFFEVTGGCAAAAAIPGSKGFLLLSMIVSFGGLSVIFQIISCFKGMEFSFWPYLATRLLHMAIASAMAMPLYRRYCATSAVWAGGAVPVAKNDPGAIPAAICLIGMCAVLLLSLERDNSASAVTNIRSKGKKCRKKSNFVENVLQRASQ